MRGLKAHLNTLEAASIMLIEQNSVLVGSRAWAPETVTAITDHDCVVTRKTFKKLSKIIGINKNYINDSYTSHNNALRTIYQCKVRLQQETFNLLVIEKKDMNDYKKLVKIIKSKIKEPWYAKVMLDRENRKAIMQSILVSLEKKQSKRTNKKNKKKNYSSNSF